MDKGPVAAPPVLVFVYGSLMQGEYNHKVLEAATYLGDKKLRGPYRMVCVGPFPGVVDQPKSKAEIAGELYAVDNKTLSRVDALEGHPKAYHRKLLGIDGQQAWVYLMPPKDKNSYPAIPSGNWRTYQSEHPPKPKSLK